MVLTVVGIGSRQARDDAIGLDLVESLQKMPTQTNIAILLWENADALTVAHDLLELDGPVLVVDCADMGVDRGEWRTFSLEKGQIKHHHGSISTHGLGMAEALTIARELGFGHPVHLFGIQPFDLSPLPTLSSPMQERLPALLRALMATIHNLCPPDEQQVILLAEPLKRSILAMGVESKNSLAWGSRAQVTLSPPLGDLADPTARTALEEAVRRRMDDASPECIAVDLHPDMFPSLLGRRLARERGIPVIAVQHHFAHAAACMAESGLKESLALAFDGMGWGTDATLWGAELLHMVPGQSRRLGTFTPVPLPGGDAAVRRPVRQLLARRVDAGVEISAGWCQRLGLSATEAAIWTHQCRNHLHAPLSHAAGRLFDAFAAQLGVAPQTITHEGEPAIRLEALARSFSGKIFPHHHLPFSLREHGEMVYIDWRETFRQFPEDRVFGPDEAALWAYVFHQAVAAAMLAMVEFGTKRTGLGTVVLSGGVFMNKILTQRLAGDLQDRGYRVFQHQRVPTGDAGIALGQVWMIGGME